jgi:2-methylisocitrate lyase-like PEP mutase family enzyme
MTSQADKGRAFRALHDRKKLFVIPNPWDGASAKLLASQGFEALTTTSAGLAFVLGLPDGGVTREQSLGNAKLIVDSVDLPVAADLENGFGHRPEDAAEAIRAAAAIGLVGGSIEDATGDPESPIYDFGRISMTRSSGCRPSRRPGRMCCSRRGCRGSTRSGRWCSR